MKRRGKRIVTSSMEHSSVIEAMQKLEKDGYEVIYLLPDEKGKISLESISNAVTKDTILVSIMAVNNEIGSINPVDKIKKIIEKANSPALLHVDAVQAFGKIPLKPKKWGIDILTASSHKIHGPKGAGILYLRKGARIMPLHYGGEQEKKIRPGTEPLPNICGMGEAVRNLPDISGEMNFMRELNNYFRNKLNEIENVHINSDTDCLPYIINFSVNGIKSETMLHYMAQNDIYISSGSACAKGKKSHVLTAMGLNDKRADSALRISFSHDSTPEEADVLINAVKEGVQTLVKSV